VYRTVGEWRPAGLLYKRFGISEPEWPQGIDGSLLDGQMASSSSVVRSKDLREIVVSSAYADKIDMSKLEEDEAKANIGDGPVEVSLPISERGTRPSLMELRSIFGEVDGSGPVSAYRHGSKGSSVGDTPGSAGGPHEILRPSSIAGRSRVRPPSLLTEEAEEEQDEADTKLPSNSKETKTASTLKKPRAQASDLW
jgi:hypothetical protein